MCFHLSISAKELKWIEAAIFIGLVVARSGPVFHTSAGVCLGTGHFEQLLAGAPLHIDVYKRQVQGGSNTGPL